MSNYNVNEISAKVIQMADELAKDFNLPLRHIEFVKSDTFHGRCFRDGTIEIKLFYGDGELASLMDIWKTLCHEMAHLKYFNHNHEFWVLNRDITNKLSEKLGKKIRPELAFTERGVVY